MSFSISLNSSQPDIATVPNLLDISVDDINNAVIQEPLPPVIAREPSSTSQIVHLPPMVPITIQPEPAAAINPGSGVTDQTEDVTQEPPALLIRELEVKTEQPQDTASFNDNKNDGETTPNVTEASTISQPKPVSSTGTLLELAQRRNSESSATSEAEREFNRPSDRFLKDLSNHRKNTSRDNVTPDGKVTWAPSNSTNATPKNTQSEISEEDNSMETVQKSISGFIVDVVDAAASATNAVVETVSNAINSGRRPPTVTFADEAARINLRDPGQMVSWM